MRSHPGSSTTRAPGAICCARSGVCDLNLAWLSFHRTQNGWAQLRLAMTGAWSDDGRLTGRPVMSQQLLAVCV